MVAGGASGENPCIEDTQIRKKLQPISGVVGITRIRRARGVISNKEETRKTAPIIAGVQIESPAECGAFGLKTLPGKLSGTPVTLPNACRCRLGASVRIEA